MSWLEPGARASYEQSLDTTAAIDASAICMKQERCQGAWI